MKLVPLRSRIPNPNLTGEPSISGLKRCGESRLHEDLARAGRLPTSFLRSIDRSLSASRMASAVQIAGLHPTIPPALFETAA